MSITTIDSYPAMRDILTAPLADPPRRLEQMLRPIAVMYQYFPGEADLVSMHHMGSGLRIDRVDDRALASEVIRVALYGCEAQPSRSWVNCRRRRRGARR